MGATGLFAFRSRYVHVVYRYRGVVTDVGIFLRPESLVGTSERYEYLS